MARWWWTVVAAGCDGGVELDGTSPEPDPPNCDGASTYVAGFSVVSAAGLTVTLVDAVPAPPDVGDNLWTVTVTDAAGAPVSGLASELTPWMPLHAHGLVPPAYPLVEKAAGSYAVDPFDLIMPGLWEFTLDVGSEGAPDPVVFRFCAQG
ncbi:MAG: FixH family protein [Myxococcota bacterium]